MTYSLKLQRDDKVVIKVLDPNIWYGEDIETYKESPDEWVNATIKDIGKSLIGVTVERSNNFYAICPYGPYYQHIVSRKCNKHTIVIKKVS